MAKVLVSEDYLEDIADAIREKKASEDTYNPSEMADAIESIQTSESATLVTKTITENGTYSASSDNADGYSSVTVNVPSSGYEAADWFDINKPVGDITTSLSGGNQYSHGYLMYGRKKIGKVTAPNLTGAGPSMFQDSSLTQLIADNVQSFGQNAFRGCTQMVYAVFPKGQVNGTATYYGCSNLEAVDFGATGGGRIYTQVFMNCTKLKTIILRSTTLIPMDTNYAAFSGTPFASGGSGGTIYIPKSLYDELGTGSANDYKAANNWSTMDGYGTITWAQIEGSIYETQYADGRAIPTS